MGIKTDLGPLVCAATCFVVFLSSSIKIASVVNEIQPQPYLDEVFHVPQSLAYFHGNYSQWDNKITTLPGLYCFSNLLINLGPMIGFNSTIPTAEVYRSVNLVINSMNFWAIYVLLNLRENGSGNNFKIAFATLTLSLFPLHYFFSFLYYTDPLSTFFVLYMIICSKTKRHKTAAFSGLCAVLTRQTNIIWIVWNCTVIAWDLGKDIIIPEIEKAIMNMFPPPPGLNNTSSRAERRFAKKMVPTSGKKLFKLWTLYCKRIWSNLFAHAIVLLLFILFVFINGSIVVGDKAAHKASINTPQIFYFALFYGFFRFSTVLFNCKKLVSSIRGHFLLFTLLVICGIFIVKFNTQVHPYLLADNRHYTFYIWKRVYEWFPIVKYCLIPIYISFGFHICLDCAQHPGLTFCTLTFIFIALVPQSLLEFRYFIIPFYILQFCSKSFEWKHLIPEFILYLVINYLTINLFLYKPFTWAGSNDTQRFMW